MAQCHRPSSLPATEGGFGGQDEDVIHGSYKIHSFFFSCIACRGRELRIQNTLEIHESESPSCRCNWWWSWDVVELPKASDFVVHAK